MVSGVILFFARHFYALFDARSRLSTSSDLIGPESDEWAHRGPRNVCRWSHTSVSCQGLEYVEPQGWCTPFCNFLWRNPQDVFLSRVSSWNGVLQLATRKEK